MLYTTTISYEKKSISFKMPKKYFSGNYTLPEFLKLTREFNNQSFDDVKSIFQDKLKILAENYESMESEKIPITYDFIVEFSEAYNIPKKIKRLTNSQEQENRTGFAGRLYHLRIKENKTQEEIANKLNISRTAYAGYESGKSEPDLKTLVKIADLFDTSLDILTGRITKGN